MKNQLLTGILVFFFGLLTFSQNELKSSFVWQVENLANGTTGTFSLIIMNDESCAVSLITTENTYHSKDCFLSKATVTDYDGKLYELDFGPTGNFGVAVNLKGKKVLYEFRSSLAPKNIQASIPIQPTKPKEVITEKTEKESPPIIPAEKVNTKKEKEIKEVVKKPIPKDIKEEEVSENSSESNVASSSTRKVIYQPVAVNTCPKVYGTIVFDVTISQTGRVISSKINIGQSRNPTSCLVSNAISLLKQMRWETIDANYEEDLEVTFAFEKEEKKKKKK